MSEVDLPLSARSVLAIGTGDGAKARIHLNGAHVASWSPAGSDADRLFVSPKSLFGPGVSIRGGVPICFPQFGSLGDLPQHGFARTSPWGVTSTDEGPTRATATFTLIDSDATQAIWPHGFEAIYTVTLEGDTLDLALSVINTDRVPFTFTAALHPYFRVADAYATLVEGLDGVTYRDALQNGATSTETHAQLPIDGPIDRVYLDAARDLVLREPTRALAITRRGFPDAVVWNPGADGVTRRDDFHTGDERKMLCVEGGAIGTPVALGPGARWSASLTVRALG